MSQDQILQNICDYAEEKDVKKLLQTYMMRIILERPGNPLDFLKETIAANPYVPPKIQVNHALLIAAWDDDCASSNPIKKLAGDVRYRAFKNDVKVMEDFLMNKRNFKQSNIVTYNATKDTSLPEIKHLFFDMQAKITARVAASDREEHFLYIHYSGHGTYKSDFGGDENDEDNEAQSAPSWGLSKGFKWSRLKKMSTGKEEVLAIHAKCKMPDVDLHKLLDFGENCSILVTLDCCHSGGMCDLLYKYKEETPGGLYQPVLARSDVETRSPLHRVVCISACTLKQEAFTGSEEGNLTKTLMNVWLEESTPQPLLNARLMKRIHGTISSMTKGSQLPVLSSSFKLSQNAIPFDPKTWVAN